MKNLIEILEELGSINQMTIYHASKNSNLSGTMANDDFNPGLYGSGSAYGRGFYSVWKKEDLNIKRYGDFVYKGVINLNDSNILIVDPLFYKELKKPIPEDYIQEQTGIPYEKNSIWNDFELPSVVGNKVFYYNKKYSIDDFISSDLLKDLLSEYPSIIENFDGVAYRGKIDGHCLLMWDYKKVKIIGKYNVKTNKTNLDLRNYKKQKSLKGREEKFERYTIYSKGKIKIKKYSNEYRFFNGEISVAILLSRDMKKDYNSDILGDLKKAKKFLVDYKIPKKIVDNLTFTNGKKIINIYSAVKMFEKRNNAFLPYTHKNIEEDIKNNYVFKRLKKLKGEQLYRYIGNLDFVARVSDKNSKDKLINQMEKEKIIISDFKKYPKFLICNPKAVIDCSNGKLRENLINYPEYFKEIKGKLIKLPKMVSINLDTAINLSKEKSEIDLTWLFHKTKLGIVQNEKTTKSLKSIKKFTNCILALDNLDNFYAGLETLPSVMFSNFYKPEAYIPKCKKIETLSVNDWKFPKGKVNHIFYHKGMEKETIDMLKKKNPNIDFSVIQ